MKKLLFIAASVCAVISVVSCGTSKKSASGLSEKAVTSGLDEKVQEWKERGLSTTGAMSTFTMRDLLEAHNKKIQENPDNIVPLYGNGIGPDKTTARFDALNSAATVYATTAGSVVSGGMSAQFSNFGEMGKKLMGAYTQKVQEYIMPVMKESVAVVRVIPNGEPNAGKYEIEAYYLVDEAKAVTARKNAMDAALKETATEQVFGSAVDEWVKKFVAPEAE